MEREALKQLIKQLLLVYLAEEETHIPIGVSNRHLHVSEKDFKSLFPGEELQVMKWLKQPGEFAAQQTVTVVGNKGQIERVRILGPYRSATQLELSKTDARTLGVEPHIRMSGELLQTPGLTLKTNAGEVKLEQGVIVAKRHIHMPSHLASKFQVSHGEEVSVQVKSDQRALIFDGCVVRVGDDFALEMHIDTDEANAANVSENSVATIVSH